MSIIANAFRHYGISCSTDELLVWSLKHYGQSCTFQYFSESILRSEQGNYFLSLSLSLPFESHDACCIYWDKLYFSV